MEEFAFLVRGGVFDGLVDSSDMVIDPLVGGIHYMKKQIGIFQFFQGSSKGSDQIRRQA